MNTQQLITALGIDSAQLQVWLAAGLPHRKAGRGRQFDADAVQAWLLANGHVKGPRYVGTMEQAATACGIHPRTLASWIRQGAPGKTAEGYDIDSLLAWKSNRHQADPLLSGTVSPMLERYRRERWKLARLERRERERELIPLAEALECGDRLAAGFRHACERIQRLNLCGVEAVKEIREVLDDDMKTFIASLGGQPATGENTHSESHHTRLSHETDSKRADAHRIG